LFLQNYAGGLWNHTWSLAVEEHFYLLLPPILAVILAARPTSPFSAIPWLAAVIGAVCLALRIHTWTVADAYSHLTHVFPTHLRIDGLFFGVALAYVYHFSKDKVAPFVQRWRRVLSIAGACAFLPAFVFTLETSAFLNTVGFTLFSAGAAMLVVAVVETPDSESAVRRLQAFFGAHSYSIYLWHMPVALWLMPAFTTSPLPIYLAVYLAASLLLGTLMAVLVEKPALRVRDRLFSRPAAATP
jgi:peptidoglycan/LPS O-acetylase OafA/YrhL